MESIWSSIVGFLTFDPARLLAADMLVRIGLQTVLLCGSAFFSGSETALFSLSRLELQQLRRSGHSQADTLHALLDEPRRLIVSILCGNELVNIAAVANMTGLLVALYGEAKAGWIAVLVMLALLLLVGEVTPKTIAVSNPPRIAGDLVARPMRIWVRLVAPLRWVIRAVSDRITTWIVGPQRSPEHLLQIDEFKSLIEDYAESGRLDASARALINNLVAAGTTEIVKIMTPRSSTVFLSTDLELPELVQRFRQLRHWRVPVYREHRDNLIGFLYAEDLVRLQASDEALAEMNIDELLRPPTVVPLTKYVDEMFDFFRSNESRAAAVLNEFGGVAGFITMNDVLRFIFGPLTAAPDTQTAVLEVGPEVYEAPGDTRLAEFDSVTHFGIRDPRMTTIAGVAFRHIDRLPQVGDVAVVEGVELTVLEMDAHRIARVRAARGAQAVEAAPCVDAESDADAEETA